MLKKLILPIIAVLFSTTNSFSQEGTGTIDPDNFSTDGVGISIIAKLNEMRWNMGVDSVSDNEILKKAAQDLADHYAGAKKVTIEPGFAGMLVKKYKGTINVGEASVDVSGGKSKNMLTYEEVAHDAFEKLLASKKFEPILKNPKYYYCGIGSSYNYDNHKVYVSIVFGGVESFNTGSKDRKKLPIRFTKSKRGLSPFDEKSCKSCSKFPDLYKLNQKVYISNNLVYLEFDDFKRFKKFFRNSTDGLAVDIVTKKQYPCNGENIMDHNLTSKGYMLKPVYQQKLFSKNETLKDNPKSNTYKAVIGKIKKKYVPKLKAGEYEINLMYIVDRTVCRVMTHNYLEDGGIEEITPLTIYPDTVTSTDPKRYFPENQDQTLEFTIYFEQGKSNYDTKDIKSFIDALKEPQFIVNDINIEAHSSLEGDSTSNAKLQKDRAQSIVDALQKYQNKKVTYNITTSDSWQMFQDSIKGTEFNDLLNLPKSQVKQQLDGALQKKLEPILAKERFALITMKVTYDVTGKNEENFVVSSYRKAIEKKNIDLAKKISRYIVQQIVKKRYKPDAFLAVSIPVQPPYASLLINKLFIDNKYNHADSIYRVLADTLDQYYKVMPANDYIAWNKYMTFVKLDPFINSKVINETQGKINELYNKNIPQKLNDALNLEWQFKVMEAVDTLDPGVPNPTMQACMDRVQKIFKIEEANWQNSLKLAYIFIKHGDLKYAMKLLAPYVTQDNVDEQLLFTYISVAAQFPDEIFSRNFRLSMLKASKLNKSRYCDLFGTPFLSFQIMDNPNVKKQYCESCVSGQ